MKTLLPLIALALGLVSALPQSTDAIIQSEPHNARLSVGKAHIAKHAGPRKGRTGRVLAETNSTLESLYNITDVNITDSSDGPLCAKTSKCTNPRWNISDCTQAQQDWPGLDVPSLAQGNSKSFSLQYSQPVDIINCGNLTDRVEQVVAQNMEQARLAIADMKANGTNSPWGYEAFFKTAANVPDVTDFMNMIMNATVPYEDGCFGGAHPAAVCVNNHTGIPKSLRDNCDELGGVFASDDYPSAMFICPDMFDYGTKDQLPVHMTVNQPYVHCPTFDSKGRVKTDDGTFSLSTDVDMFNTLAWIYMQDSLDAGYIDDVQTAIDNDEDSSVYDGANYAYYATCKFNPGCPWNEPR